MEMSKMKVLATNLRDLQQSLVILEIFCCRTKKIMHHPSLSDIGSQRQIFVLSAKPKVNFVNYINNKSYFFLPLNIAVKHLYLRDYVLCIIRIDVTLLSR